MKRMLMLVLCTMILSSGCVVVAGRPHPMHPMRPVMVAPVRPVVLVPVRPVPPRVIVVR